MFPSSIVSQISRLALLSVFCAGLFITSGEVRMTNDRVHLGTGGVYSAMAAETKKEPVNEAMNGLIEIYNIALELLGIFVVPLIMLAGWLLSPDWTFGDIFGLRPILHSMWILISNVVYVIFGFMLVFVAFANIFGGENAKVYEMKSILPKLVTGMLMVPFTWFIVSAVLSISNVLTASVIQLPVDTIHKMSDTKVRKFFDTEKIIPKEMTLDLTDQSKKGETGESKNKSFQTPDCKTETDKCYSISEFLSNTEGGAYNLLTAYAYGIFKIDKYKDIKNSQIQKGVTTKVGDLFRKITLGLVFFIVFGILIIAIVYALFTRAIMLWLFAIFSPLFALNYVLGNKMKSIEKLSVTKFLSLAMVPVYVSAALAFGLMFLSLAMNPASYDNTDSVGKRTSKDGTETFKMGGVTLTTIGDPNMADDLTTGFDTGQGVISTIIIGLLALVILWMAVMGALGADEITKAAVAPIQSMGTKVGEIARSAPQYIPLPVPGAKGQSMKSMSQGVTTIMSDFDTRVNKKALEFSKPFMSKENAANTEAINNLTNTLKHRPTDYKDHAAKLEALIAGKTSQELSQNGVTRGGVLETLKKYGIDKDFDDTKLSSQTGMAEALGKIDDYLEPKGVADGIIKGRTKGGSYDNHTIDNGIPKTTQATTTSSTASIPATPPATGVINAPAINNTHITVAGTAPIATGGTTATGRTITTAQFEAIKTASGMTDTDLKAKLKIANITVV